MNPTLPFCCCTLFAPASCSPPALTTPTAQQLRTTARCSRPAQEGLPCMGVPKGGWKASGSSLHAMRSVGTAAGTAGVHENPSLPRVNDVDCGPSDKSSRYIVLSCFLLPLSLRHTVIQRSNCHQQRLPSPIRDRKLLEIKLHFHCWSFSLHKVVVVCQTVLEICPTGCVLCYWLTTSTP
jgi:hypothetical protein